MCQNNGQDMTLICRCEDITVEEVRAYIQKGITDLEQLKRLLRVGMGPCQGRTCTPLIVHELAKATGLSVEDIPLTVFRQPTTAVKMGVLAGGTVHE
ncbi:(2Fe-2S)-binding protein [Desulfotomaculum sp. 1211_IL3151]|uniref:(2Fe-2S)-binding protein n=1 Tax=Desulfotomaculum sp. 1211_IL3151 TaxID=3084055 RepID=UPI002FDB8EB3